MSVDKPESGFPLVWPIAQRRTSSLDRVNAEWIYKRTLATYRDELLAELARLGAEHVVISSNVPVRRDGSIMVDVREPDDPAVAVYFQRRDSPFVIACDKYSKVRCNVAGLAKTIEAMRAIERHGSPSMLQHAMAGFKQLPAHEANESWWVVLGVESTADAGDVERAHARLAQAHHPDRHGEAETGRMARINAARDRALRDLRGGR
jgi:hypothetical protein